MPDEPSTTAIDPPQKSLDAMRRPDALDRSFEGWSEAVFAMLDRLRAEPHIDQYKKEKPGVTEHLKDPFRRYRDDLVVNWVLPNRLGFETEKYVFSRLLKNDFGAGGCNDNLWMSFYRPETRRLEDVQITHRVSPDGFAVGIYVGSHATDLLAQAQSRIQDAPATYLDLVNPLLQKKIGGSKPTVGRAGARRRLCSTRHSTTFRTAWRGRTGFTCATTSVARRRSISARKWSTVRSIWFLTYGRSTGFTSPTNSRRSASLIR
ncbi:hypothetical protein [Salinibacter sp.]|uniref:hypothetical protein n=1 Tax=Salinibacter sp. TaxID=2065818 RepID=UPI0021E72DF0|nr:hypothetical protein [Salinibacter sp.]